MKDQTKNASGISIFLLEELGDARLRCAQLKKYVDEAVKLIEKSSHRDHLFEVGAHLIHGVPDTLLRLEKALNASSLAASKLDYEDIKDDLRPEKVDELERAMDEVRIRRVQRRSQEKENCTMNISEAAAQLNSLASELETKGTLDVIKLAGLIGDLEAGKKEASEGSDIAQVFKDLAAGLTETSEERPSRVALASILRRVLAHQIDVAAISAAADDSVRNEKVAVMSVQPHMYRFDGKSGTLDKMLFSIEALSESIYQCAKTRRSLPDLEDAIASASKNEGPLAGVPSNVVSKVKSATSELKSLTESLRKTDDNLDKLVDVLRSSKTKTASDDDDEKEARFEEGKPADPTKNMSPEDKKKWNDSNEEHKDKFKKEAASADPSKPVSVKATVVIEGDDLDPVNFKVNAGDVPVDVVSAWMKKNWGVSSVKKKGSRFSAKDRRGEFDFEINVRTAKAAAEDDEDEKEARYEEGKPADPTKEMSPEDAKKWKDNTDKYDDKFKSAAWKATETPTENPWKA